MKCPSCNVDLVMADRQGVEIDYCPKCRGVWLDRGELDKIIERTLPSRSSAESRYQDHESTRAHRPRRRESWLEDIFDF